MQWVGVGEQAKTEGGGASAELGLCESWSMSALKSIPPSNHEFMDPGMPCGRTVIVSNWSMIS